MNRGIQYRQKYPTEENYCAEMNQHNSIIVVKSWGAEGEEGWEDSS